MQIQGNSSPALTIRDAAIALTVEQLKCGSVECIGSAEQSLECLKL